MEDLDLGKLFVGDINVPPLFLVNGEGLLTLDAPIDGVRASGDTGMHDIDRRRE